jgi:hypothetical protein
MSAKGWFRLHRKLQYSEVFRDPDLLRLWILLLMKASHSERSIEWEGETVDLKAGQLVTGRKSLFNEYNDGLAPKNRVSDTTLWNWLKKLEKMGNIQIETAPSRKYSIVTILQWNEYQTDPEILHTDDEPIDTEPEQQNEEVSEEMSEFIKAGEENNKELTPALPPETETVETDKPKKKKGKRVYTKDDIEYKLAARLFYWMLKNNPNAKKPNPQKWADVIRLMIERDNRDPEEIAAIIDWCQNHDFWKTNILSTEKLRKQYDVLYMQRKAELEKKARARAGYGSGGYQSRGARKNDLLREMMEKEVRKNGSGGNNQAFLPHSERL